MSNPLRAVARDERVCATPANAGSTGAGAQKTPSPDGGVTSAAGWKLPGFGPEARVLTTIGEVPAKLLRRNDQIVTPSGQPCAIEWIDRVGLDEGFLHTVPGATPVLVRAGTLDAHVPSRDMWMSRMQTVVTGARLQEIRSADDLCEGDAWPGGPVAYTMFHCGRPVLARVEGMWCRVDEISTRKGRRAV
ncbi:Hint domain-containing protein [Tropicimonas sp. S265A]|uniref:Hint domain-containing protein n=1 Tax=Tropicimonas sp. S265A TaxID=3415134 RepID=UPI003C7C9145